MRDGRRKNEVEKQPVHFLSKQKRREQSYLEEINIFSHLAWGENVDGKSASHHRWEVVELMESLGVEI
jgi:hypothetical protein